MNLSGIVVAIGQVFTFAIIARVLLSWFPGAPRSQLGQILFNVTEPILAPFRAIIPRFGMMDLSPIVAIIVLQVVVGIVASNV